MKHSKSGDFIKKILFIELVLIFSVASSFLISAILINEKEKISIPTIGQKHLFQNLRILKYFLNLKLSPHLSEEPDSSTWNNQDNPLVKDILVLQEANTHVQENEFQKLPSLLEKLSNRYGFLKPKQRAFSLRYLYSQKKYTAFIQKLETSSPTQDNTEIQIMYINSLIKLKQIEKAGSIFKKSFKTKNLKDFKKKIPTKYLSLFLKSLTYEEWQKKFRNLLQNNRYTEFQAEKKYASTPQLINLITAEFYYKRKQYTKAQKILKKVNTEKLQNYKYNILTKIELRKNGPENILEKIDKFKDGSEAYQELLMDVASILLIKGESQLSSQVFTKFIELDRPKDEAYYKAAWITAWLHLRQGERKKAAQLFQKGTDSPGGAYKIANYFWLSRMEGKKAKEIENYPFSYYYVKTTETKDKPQVKGSRNFSHLINGPRSRLFPHIIEDLKALLANNMLNEGIAFIRSAGNSESLTPYDRNMFKIIRSILYLKKNDFYRAFVTFRNNFECYTCIIPPAILSQVYAPLRYRELIKRYALKFNIDHTLLMALIREETMFNAGAVSPAKAFGLMQLLLRTARQMAREEGIKKRINRNHLFNPELNVRLGTRYLKYLLDKYDDKIHLALAAYNAGDHRVDNWLQQFGENETEEFIEMIPFSATRNYVKNIIRNRYYYQYYYEN